MRLLNLKKSRKQKNKIVLRFFAFVSFISVTLSAFCIGGNAYSATLPSRNVTSDVAQIRATHPFIEFKNNSLAYSSDGNRSFCYNRILVVLPQYIGADGGCIYYSSTKPAGTDYFYDHLGLVSSTSSYYLGNTQLKLFIITLHTLNRATLTAEGDLFQWCAVPLYYDGQDYFAVNRLIGNNGPLQYAVNNIQLSGTSSMSSVTFPADWNYFTPSGNSSGSAGTIFFDGCSRGNLYQDNEIYRSTISLGAMYQYAWDLSGVEYAFGGDSGDDLENIVVDISGNNSGCTCDGNNVCDCDCGFYTEQLKEDLIDYFDTNMVTKSMFLQYMGSLSSLAESYSIQANNYSLQANNYSSLAGGYSSLARSYSELATDLSGNQSLLEAQNSMVAEQNSIDNSRYAAEQSSRNAEQSTMDDIASGTTTPDSDISGGVEELSSKFDIYFNQIESFQAGLQTVPEEVSQAGVMVTNITNKLPNSIKVAIIFVLLVLVVVKVLGR